MKRVGSVDAYIGSADVHVQKQLREMRTLVKKVAPRAEEIIAYGMPAYMLSVKKGGKARPFVYFAAMKGHLGLYPTPGPIRALARILTEFSVSKGCVRIPYEAPLPKKIIISLLKERLRELREHADV